MSQLRMRWPKYWSFSFSIIPSKEHPGLISFRRDWLDLLAVQGTLKSLLQHHSSKASVLRCSAFFTVPHYWWGNWELEKSYCILSKLWFRSGKCYSPLIPLDAADLMAKSVNAKIESPSGNISWWRGYFWYKKIYIWYKISNILI